MTYSEYIEEAKALGYKVGPLLKLAGYSRHAASKDASRNDDTVSERYVMLLDAIRYRQQAYNADSEYKQLIASAYSLKDNKAVQAQLRALQAVVDGVMVD